MNLLVIDMDTLVALGLVVMGLAVFVAVLDAQVNRIKPKPPEQPVRWPDDWSKR